VIVISALILAVAVAGQLGDAPAAPKGSKPPHPPIDVDYVPKALDRALLGCWSRESPDDQIAEASCFSSIERARQFYEEASEEDEPGGISGEPDGYTIRAGTAVTVTGRQIMSYADKDKARQTAIFKVQPLEGEFKGKQFYTFKFCVFRYVEGADAVPQAAAAKNRPMRRAAPATPAVAPSAAKLVLTDLVINTRPGGTYANVDGRFRCTSNTPLESVRATISFEDRDGNLIRSEDVYCTPNQLNPADVGSFSAMPEADARYARMKIVFKDARQSLPWVDQSGMNAHE
jgi:hypothetical protein